MLSQKADRALAGPVAFGLLVTPVCLGIYAAAKANHLWGTKRGAQERSLVSMRFLLRALIRSCFWLKVEEPEEEDWKELALPQDKGCILMFNHTSMFDGFLMAAIMPSSLCRPVWKSKIDGVFVLNYRVVLHAIDATPARWRGDASSSPLDRARAAACTRCTG